MKTVVALQSNYLPWKGYFDLIHDAQLFIFYDDLQYTIRDWRNRNKIKASGGCEWVTVPAGSDRNRLICEVELTDASWQQKHWKTLQQNYRATPYFERYQEFFEHFYLDRPWIGLSQMNQYLIKHIAKEFLGIRTEFMNSSEFVLLGQKQDRLLDLVTQAGADRYISGPAARDYIEPHRFEEAGVELLWKDYSGYPVYPQRFPPFEHGVSVLDLLFNVGPNAPWYIWGWRESPVGP